MRRCDPKLDAGQLEADRLSEHVLAFLLRALSRRHGRL
jgi:hypothetical protein